MNWLIIDRKIREWLEEDMNNGDVTTDFLIDEDAVSAARLIARESGVAAGLEVMKRVFQILDGGIVVDSLKKDGERMGKGKVLAVVQGKTRSILQGERLALNILQRMSGIATETAKYVELLRGLNTKLVDTRKTTPGLRILEKYAVRVGGGCNHRFNLSEAVLVKDNHIKASGGIKEAVWKIKKAVSHTMKIEVEVETLEQLEEAVSSGADIVLLDNMDVATMKEAVRRNKGRAILEASGGISLANVRQVAETGVDIISVGAITHSAKALDISLKFC
ncbi:MAG: carboxylating nicotinate-nucleotide diphosphorylase [Peptococcaceae bacterium]|jgi:nicotinate-nucleotide pyrophosphorylase (carboxylating)|nr:carboxylating nicotinate-nucleotide diphosphorylase [Peptococcaceae bacterium]MDH7524920.1 carboxylating nicotinate-nucleotide diphosphorylase [Peptococcaceae bacterium]